MTHFQCENSANNYPKKRSILKKEERIVDVKFFRKTKARDLYLLRAAAVVYLAQKVLN